MSIHAIVRRGAVCAISAVALIGMTVGPATAVGSSEGSSAARDHLLGKTSKGIHIFNNTLGKMVLTGTGGDNAGHQPVGETLQPGVGYHDFEVVFRAAKKTTDWANYDLYDAAGNKTGTAVLQMSVDAFGDTSAKGTFTGLNGSALPFTVSGYSSGFQVVSTSSNPATYQANDPMAANIVDSFCNNPSTTYTCTFIPGSRAPATQMKLLATSYNKPGGSNEPSSLSISSGYKASSSDTWSVSGSIKIGLEGVFSAGIKTTYGEGTSFENTFTASEAIEVDPGYTGYIWGSIPVTTFAGTIQIKLGGSTYSVQQVQVNTPDASRPMSSFRAGTWAGEDPLNSPDTPPDDAVALP
ncbi:hypothetical protein [Corynebacterium pacaense]|uniref:hypothetical protein n=1 Tax=Corynebacterium pacaense TaxID=1816684 RepID=UPI001177B94B|nr:hypothetical protein [Corynebacterium pacaense]